MKTIPLAQAIEELSRAMAVQVDQDSLCYPDICPDDGENRGLFLLLTTAYGDETFHEADNQTVQIHESGAMRLVNTRGQPTSVMLMIASPVCLPDDEGVIDAASEKDGSADC